MGDLSQHFSRHEFACKCGCGFDTVDAALLATLERVRTHYDRPVTINSGCRCPAHNKAIDGSPRSQHMLGRAADIVVAGVMPNRVADFFDDHPGGLCRYDTFTHVDSRGYAARQDFRSVAKKGG